MRLMLAFICLSVITIAHLSRAEISFATFKEFDPEETVTTEATTTTTIDAKAEFFALLPTFAVPRRTKIPAHPEIKKQCHKMKSNRLKQACKKVAENHVVIEMEDRAAAFLTNDEEDNFYKKNKSERYLRYLGTFGRPLPGEYNCDVSCPSVKEWTSATDKHDRSFSPWAFCDHYDPNRLPQWISYAKCKCSGCMDQATGEENVNFNSVSLKTTISIIMKDSDISFDECNNKKCKESIKEISIGCHCVLPSTTT